MAISPISRIATAPPASTKTATTVKPTSVTLDKTAFVLAPDSHTATAPINQTAPVATDATLAQHVPEPIFVRSSDTLDLLSLQKLIGDVQDLQLIAASQHSTEAGPSQVGFTASDGFPPNAFQVTDQIDQTTNQVFSAPGATYAPPSSAPAIDRQFVDITAHNLNITALGGPGGAFIHSGGGNDVLQVASVAAPDSQRGNYLLNAGGGSNTLIGANTATGFRDILMADADPTQSVTDQFQGFEALDDIVVRGLSLQDFSFSLADNAAHNQLTITAAQIANPAIETNIVISGYSTADVNAGRLQLAFSSDGAGSNFMVVHAA